MPDLITYFDETVANQQTINFIFKEVSYEKTI